MENKFTENENFENELNRLINHEESEIHHLKDELHEDGEELHRLQKLKQDNEERHKHPQDKVCLLFIVNGTPFKIYENENAILQVAVIAALKESGNEGRKLEDWTVKFNNMILDMKLHIKDFHFPECAELFLSPVAGKGGNF
jgi:hypothetical protein